jgi:demethylmenaquinone methyltransferase/2-methoxy-6-polyprenyl-1,4-benzoquinol methylase
VVRPGGRIALLDVAQPPNPLLRFGHGIYFGKVVPLVGGLLSDKQAYAYLPKSVAYLPEPEEMVSSLQRHGFADARRSLFTVGISQLFSGTRDRT